MAEYPPLVTGLRDFYAFTDTTGVGDGLSLATDLACPPATCTDPARVRAELNRRRQCNHWDPVFRWVSLLSFAPGESVTPQRLHDDVVDAIGHAWLMAPPCFIG